MAKIGSWFFCLFFCTQFSWGAITVQPVFDRPTAALGDMVVYSVRVTTDDTVSMEDPEMLSFEGFEVMNSWVSQESRSSFVAGQGFQSVQSQVYNYQIVPRRAGLLTVGPGRIRVEGQVYQIRPLSLKVLSAGQQAPSARGQGRGQTPDPFSQMDDMMGDMDDMFQQLLKRRMGQPNFPEEEVPRKTPGQIILPSGDKSDFFIAVQVDKKEVYQGEQLTASYYIYTPGQIVELDTLQYPSLQSFWKEDLEVATVLNFQPEMVNGVPYRRALLASYALFPLKTGTLKIDPYKAKVSVVGTQFQQFGKTTATKQSPVVEIQVKPFPVEGKPDQFKKAVGQFQVIGSIAESQVQQYQPFTYRLRIEGTGNAKMVEGFDLALPNNLKLYDKKSTAQFNKNGTSFKNFEFVLTTEKSGTVHLPEQVLYFFDPEKKAYLKATTPALEVQVVAGQKPEGYGTPLVEKTEGSAQKNLGPLVLPWVTSATLSSGLDTSSQLKIWSLLVLVCVVVLLFKAFKELGLGQRKQSLLNIIERRKKRVEDLIKKADVRNVGTQMINLLNFVIGELSGLGGGSYELDKMLAKTSPSVRRELSAQFSAQMDGYQAMAFAPTEALSQYKDPKVMKQTVEKTFSMIDRAIDLTFKEEEVSAVLAEKSQ